MKKLVRKDKHKRELISNAEVKHFVFKNIVNNHVFQSKIRWKAALNLSKNFKNFNFQSLINRCIFTSRKKRINKLYSFSRIIFLKLARSGYINGLKKASW